MIIHNCTQGSHEWHQLRLGKITGSRLKKMMAKDNLALIDELIAEEQVGIADDDARVNPNGGAIALGHPLGMSGARLIATATHEMQERKLKRALATMCIGVGQGIAIILERV